MKTLRSFVWTILVLATTQTSFLGCSAESDGFFFGALGLNEGRILVVNSQATPFQQTITMYDPSGKFLGVVADTSAENITLRGLSNWNGLSVIVAQETPDQLSLLNLFSGEMSVYVQNVQLTGNIFDVVADRSGNSFVVESNTIERFSNDQRIPAAGATPYIATTIGACTINTARGLALTANNRLLVVSEGNDRLMLYGLAGASSATCFTSYNSFVASVNPSDAIAHSDGNLYIVGNGSDIVYSSPEAAVMNPAQIFLNLGVVDSPTAIAELPNGNLIVASDVHDSIVEITTSGTLVNANFIKNAFTSNVVEILVIPPQ